MMDFLVQRGALINSADYHGATPLHISCQKGHQNIVVCVSQDYGIFLLYFGFKPKCTTFQNFHPLKAVSPYRNQQLQVGENYSYITNVFVYFVAKHL